MKKRFTICFLLAISFLLYPTQYVSANTTYVRLSGDIYAQVLQVIDGDALRVQPAGTSQVALVRLAGITTTGRRDAQDFMTGALLGRTVELRLSAAEVPNLRFDDRWASVYVIYNQVVYNRALVQHGLAWVEPGYQGNWMYSTLVSDAARAHGAGLGIWEETGFRTDPIPHRRRFGIGGGRWDERVNINTATAAQINRVLYDTRSGVGSEIVRSRPFRDVDEVRFIGILGRDEFDYFWDAMKVSTNINTATEAELIQLFDVNANAARDIIRFRERQRFHSIYQLRDENLMSTQTFERNRPFMAVHYVDEIVGVHSGIIMLDVNDATVQEWMSLPGNMPRSFANLLVNETRRRPFNNMTELRNFFYDHRNEDIYYRIRRFLVLR